MVKRLGLIILAPFVAVVTPVAVLVGAILFVALLSLDVLFAPGSWK